LNINYFWTPLIGQCQDRFALCVIGIVMDLDWLKDFLALAEQKNFSRAADVRNVTQPAFSRRVRALEDWIGTPLFVRGAQGATLTPAGSYFRPLADDLMRSLHRARRDTRAVGERAGATLSIAATHALSFTFFPGWIRRHMRFEALGTLNLISDSMEACEQIMLGGEVHFLLCHYHAAAPTRFDPPPVPEHPGGRRCAGPGLRAGRGEPPGLAASRHTGETDEAAHLQPSFRAWPDFGGTSSRLGRNCRSGNRLHVASRCDAADHGPGRTRYRLASTNIGGRRPDTRAPGSGRTGAVRYSY
jgi:DNA-binding transcriptional LysR family regulator